MSEALVLDGKATARIIRDEVRESTLALLARGVQPSLVVVLVGDDPASQVYVRNKDRAAQEAGFSVRTLRLPAATSQETLAAEVRALSLDRGVHGILVQLPLPHGLQAHAILESLDPYKDVDGLHSQNVAALVMGRPGMRPCTPLGCIELLDRHELPLEGRHMVVIGRSLLVGKPLALLALERNASVTVCHSKSRDLPALARSAEILVAAVGRERLVRGDWVREGAVVLDVGMNRTRTGELVGDVDYGAARARAAAITPVPGGIGPMTIAMLLRNTLRAALLQSGIDVEPPASHPRVMSPR